jgi:hypothetical protein
MSERHNVDRPGRSEDEYFHRRDQELLEEARRAKASAEERHALAEALGITDDDLVQRLQALGFTPDTAWLVEWLPAIQLGWLKGLTRAERDWLLDRIRTQRDPIVEAAARRLDEWVATKPDDTLFDTARQALRARLDGASPDEREALRSAVLDSARGVCAASGGVLGIGSVSAAERAALDVLANELATPRIMGKGAL